MVNGDENSQGAAERRLVLSYAPAEARDALAALLALDATFAGVVRAAREPMVGQMRLTWWHDALTRLDVAPPPAQPVLVDAAELLLPRGVGGVALAGMVDGWEALLDPGALDGERLDQFAAERGGRLFALAGLVLGDGEFDRLAQAGEGWALADLAQHVGDPADRVAASAVVRVALEDALSVRWPRRLRALGALALLARLDNEGVTGAGARTWRLLRHRLTGR